MSTESKPPAGWALVHSWGLTYNRVTRVHGTRDLGKKWLPIDKITPKRLFMRYPCNYDRVAKNWTDRYYRHESRYRSELLKIHEGPHKPQNGEVARP